MSKLTRLAKLNKIITRLEDLGFTKEADSIHQEFIKIAQEGDARRILRMKVARAMGYTADVSDAEIFANIIRISDYLKPERLINPKLGPSPSNAYIRNMAGATPENSYAVDYWKKCMESYDKVAMNSDNMAQNLLNNVDALRMAARSGNMNMILNIFSKIA